MLKFLDQHQVSVEDFTTKLMQIYQIFEFRTYFPDNLIFKHFNEEFSINSQHHELLNRILSHFFATLKVPYGHDWHQRVEISQGDYFKGFLTPSYFYLQALEDVLGREEAIRLFKKFTSMYIISRNIENPKFVNLETSFKNAIEDNDSDWEILRGMTDTGKYFYRNNNCLWIDALDELKDTEFKYLVCCYGDYQYATEYANKHIILTMEHTIAQGDPYCSRMLHDTREDFDLRHPNTEFWDGLDDSPLLQNALTNKK
ncbi:MAG: L-2-amino-thiazoline-4-carboxylic acid hydrolase [Candidatus Heimdallarchaeota archaeon]|nr:L-2-amino-thiazoline-4-carboxylic acid hydrolase [Candidatus Heimdallarchaeota archaeon]